MVMISAGVAILAWQSFQHWQAARHGSLKPFDEDGERVSIPFLGVVCLGGGMFLLVLTSGQRK